MYLENSLWINQLEMNAKLKGIWKENIIVALRIVWHGWWISIYSGWIFIIYGTAKALQHNFHYECYSFWWIKMHQTACTFVQTNKSLITFAAYDKSAIYRIQLYYTCITYIVISNFILVHKRPTVCMHDCGWKWNKMRMKSIAPVYFRLDNMEK